ncbi:DinB family protein [Paeniglutamicibacter sp. NPDC091659]|uniref:mycothiol transferase n=1 Tax=Paeniglutamicibacter sp. NPDC091659 TaxID=3364389 RepID=UPI00382F1921
MEHSAASVTEANALLRDGFARVLEGIEALLDQAEPELLRFRPTKNTNHIGWLIWHLSRVQDDHFVHLANSLWPEDRVEQRWVVDGWRSRFQLPYRELDTGYGHSSGQVEAFTMFEGEYLLGYYRSVHRFSGRILGKLDDNDFDTIVDRRWDPPVTAGVRLVSVLNETTKHLGQAEFVQGIFADRG